jgi:WhiB family redox-sensing transcriptional regulator
VALTAESLAHEARAEGLAKTGTATNAALRAVTPDNWRAVAACRDTDPDLFFPIGTTGPAIDQIEAAKHVCDTCPAKQPCLEFALMTNQDSGVWGGTSEEERRKLRRAWVKNRRPAS